MKYYDTIVVQHQHADINRLHIATIYYNDRTIAVLHQLISIVDYQ